MKLAGDGTTIGIRNHCVLASFTILEEEDTVSSVDGIHPIAIFREPESYELSLALADVMKEVAELSLSGVEMEEGVSTFTGRDYYTGLLDWTTGLP